MSEPLHGDPMATFVFLSQLEDPQTDSLPRGTGGAGRCLLGPQRHLSRFWKQNPCLFLKLPSPCSIHTRTHTHTCMHTHMYTHTHTHALTHAHTLTRVHTHVGSHAGTHICAHTHMVHTRAGASYSCGARESPTKSETKTVLRAGRFSVCVSQGRKYRLPGGNRDMEFPGGNTWVFFLLCIRFEFQF